MGDHVCTVHSWVVGVFPPETEIIHISLEQGQHFAQWTSEPPSDGELGLIPNLHKRVCGLKNHIGDDQTEAKINHQLYHRGRSQSR